MPTRVQLRRSKGWRKPAGVVVVARPSRFGNPFRVGDPGPGNTPVTTRAQAVNLFAEWMDGGLDVHPHRRDTIRAHLHELEGHDLACWCAAGEPCHADVLIRLAKP